MIFVKHNSNQIKNYDYKSKCFLQYYHITEQDTSQLRESHENT